MTSPKDLRVVEEDRMVFLCPPFVYAHLILSSAVCWCAPLVPQQRWDPLEWEMLSHVKLADQEMLKVYLNDLSVHMLLSCSSPSFLPLLTMRRDPSPCFNGAAGILVLFLSVQPCHHLCPYAGTK